MIRRDERGLALVTVLTLMLFISVAIILLLKVASSQYRDATRQEKEDVVVAGAEAILDRYAAKLTIDSRYYLHWVDEAERARLCTTISASSYGTVVEPGHAWEAACTSWTYQDPDPNGDGVTDWYVHPVLDSTGAGNDIGVQLEVTASPLGSVEVLVVGKRGDTVQRRAITANVHATSLSEFFRVTEGDLSYGAYAETFGKVYSGRDLNFGSNTVAHADIFAEHQITSPPATFADGAQGYQGVSSPTYGDIRDIYPQPLNFGNFWNDLDLIRQTACGAGGICLDDADATAWRVQGYVAGGVGKLLIWKSTESHSETWWWTSANSASWSVYGTYDIPSVGTLWANADIVVGYQSSPAGVDVLDDGDSRIDFVTKGALTMYAGSNTDPRNIIINADTFYSDPDSLDILALIGSDEIVINPNAVGSDREFYINAAMLGQSDAWRFAGNAPSESTLYTNGSIATKSVGDIAAHIKYRNYGFDQRLQYLRPPMFPLLDTDWSYDDWREVTLPDWAKP